MILSAPASSGQCNQYEASYGTGHIAGCVVQTSFELGPYKLPEVKIVGASEVAPDLLAHGQTFRYVALTTVAEQRYWIDS